MFEAKIRLHKKYRNGNVLFILEVERMNSYVVVSDLKLACCVAVKKSQNS